MELRASPRPASDRPDLVLMDIQLPVLDGYDATRQIKALAGFAAIPIIAVSSFAMKGDEEKARSAGCDHYVTKPYSRSSFCASFVAFSARSREVRLVGPLSRRHVNQMNFGFGSSRDRTGARLRGDRRSP